MRRRAGGRKAVTLVELLVVLLLLGITAGVVGLTLHTARPVATIDATQAAIQAARDSAIRFGRSVTVAVAAEWFDTTHNGLSRRARRRRPDGSRQ